ncbi:NifU family protein [Ramlibacter sp.]|uniref:NifU family protein n=1 Tax=Ramlibacter sp. TaxID=1917967 RepID=UPI003D09A9D7
MTLATTEAVTAVSTPPVDTDALRLEVQRTLDDSVARFLDSHGGAVRVGRIAANGDIHLEFLGACESCPAAAATFYSRVLPAIRGIPDVGTVTTSKANISKAAIDRLTNLSSRVAHPPSRRPTSTRAHPTGCTAHEGEIK